MKKYLKIDFLNGIKSKMEYISGLKVIELKEKIHKKEGIEPKY